MLNMLHKTKCSSVKNCSCYIGSLEHTPIQRPYKNYWVPPTHPPVEVLTFSGKPKHKFYRQTAEDFVVTIANSKSNVWDWRAYRKLQKFLRRRNLCHLLTSLPSSDCCHSHHRDIMTESSRLPPQQKKGVWDRRIVGRSRWFLLFL